VSHRRTAALDNHGHHTRGQAGIGPGSPSGYLASGRRGDQPAGHIKGTWRCDAAENNENRRESDSEVKRHSGAKRLVTQTPGAVRQLLATTDQAWTKRRRTWQ
jgi:hypothetical protein